ncbi:MAG: TetR/AcrR family transcriptional regulator [Parvibaculum sp.]
MTQGNRTFVDKPLEKSLTQAERRAASEVRLLRAAAELISEGGVTAATFERIGQRAGLSRGLVSQRFGSKEGLINALVENVVQSFDEILFDHHIHELPPHEGLIAFVDIYLSDNDEHAVHDMYHVMLAESLCAQPALRPLFAGVHDVVRVRLRAMIEEGQRLGTVYRELDPDATAISLGAFLLGVRIQCMVDPRTDIEAVRKNAINSLRAMLGIGG